MENIYNLARFIIAYEDSQNRTVTNLRLQKILYFIQAQFLTEFERPCFEETIEAWDYGPVVPEIYRYYKFYGGGAIIIPDEDDISSLISDDSSTQLIMEVLDTCANYSTRTLVDSTHNQEPWINAYSGDGIISNDSIYEYFSD